MKLRNKVGAVMIGGFATAGMLIAPGIAQAETTPQFIVDDNSPALTATVTGSDAAVTVTVAEGSVVCSTPIVTRGALDADAIQQALDQAVANSEDISSIPGLPADYSTVIYPRVVSTDPPVFDPEPGVVSGIGENRSHTAALTDLDEGRYGALTSCADTGRPYEVNIAIRNFDIGTNGGTNPGDGGGGATSGSLGSLFGSSS